MDPSRWEGTEILLPTPGSVPSHQLWTAGAKLIHGEFTTARCGVKQDQLDEIP